MYKFKWSDKKHADYLESGPLRYLHRRRMNFINSHLESFLSAVVTVECLDLGCGDGLFLKDFFLRGGMKLTGCDADIERLLRARKLCTAIRLVCATADNTPFGNKAFDILILHHVLEHVSDDMKLIAECRRLLKEKGILILGVPNEDSFNGRISRLLHPKLYREGEHVNFYSEKKILHLLKLSNFSTIVVGRIGFLFPLYYIHMLLISNRVSFLLGDFLTRIFRSCADSLIIVCRLRTSEEDISS